MGSYLLVQHLKLQRQIFNNKIPLRRFIKKAMWASQASIKGNGASLKKFYAFMHEKGFIDKEDLEDLKDTIKEGMPEWLATLKRYDDPSVDDVWQM